MRKREFKVWDTCNKTWMTYASKRLVMMDMEGDIAHVWTEGAERSLLYLDMGTLRVCDYVGRNDKEGNKIYEGDVFQMFQGEQEKRESAFEVFGVVQFRHGSYSIECRGALFSSIIISDLDGNFEIKRRWTGSHGSRDIYEECYGITKIGNIYENPDLIK